jgi:WD40 repeat protein
MWKLENEIVKDGSKDQHARTVRSALTLNDDYDYVKGIAYSSFGKVLFSAADNGMVRKWDLNVGKSEGNRKVNQDENMVSQLIT